MSPWLRVSECIHNQTNITKLHLIIFHPQTILFQLPLYSRCDFFTYQKVQLEYSILLLPNISEFWFWLSKLHLKSYLSVLFELLKVCAWLSACMFGSEQWGYFTTVEIKTLLPIKIAFFSFITPSNLSFNIQVNTYATFQMVNLFLLT